LRASLDRSEGAALTPFGADLLDGYRRLHALAGAGAADDLAVINCIRSREVSPNALGSVVEPEVFEAGAVVDAVDHER
jgi:hypothetical protein